MSKTPCEKLGYKVGDKFEVVAREEYSEFSIGSIIELYKDDGSYVPLFKLLEGVCAGNYAGGKRGAYLELRYIRPLKEPIEPSETDDPVMTNYPTSDFKISLKDMSDVEKNIAKEWLKEVAKSRGFLHKSLGWKANFYWIACRYDGGMVDYSLSEEYFQKDEVPELKLTFETAITGFSLPNKKSKEKLQLEELIINLSKQLEEAQSELNKINSKG